jgi:transposase
MAIEGLYVPTHANWYSAFRSELSSLLFLPPYNPDFNPIENAFAKLKALLREPQNAPSTVCGTGSAISSTASRHKNVQTTSLRRDTMQPDQKWL